MPSNYAFKYLFDDGTGTSAASSVGGGSSLAQAGSGSDVSWGRKTTMITQVHQVTHIRHTKKAKQVIHHQESIVLLCRLIRQRNGCLVKISETR